ncbi:MAG: sulfate ABC transporter permease subunit CysT [Planctomycetes bacterium]|nr:sulfate ABC transporter permease subunit CysT [Planctomycetota bacterium]
MAASRRILPGFGLTLGVTVAWLGLIVLIPLAALVAKSTSLSWEQFWGTVTSERTLAAFGLSFGAAAVAALVNLVAGAVIAWALVRYRFPGRRLVDAVIDLPFALPTAVAGIALTTLYAPNGWIGALLEPLGIQVAFTRLGVVMALIFIGLPFVVRTVQPVLEEIPAEFEEAAASLGASRLTVVLRVLLPEALPALITGTTLAFARAVGEYGSVIFIAGNIQGQTEIAPLLIVIQLEQYNYAEATAIAVVMLVLSFALLLAVNLLQRWSNRRFREST